MSGTDILGFDPLGQPHDALAEMNRLKDRIAALTAAPVSQRSKPMLVRVVWLDSHVFGGWKSIAEWRSTFSRERLVCQSVGWQIIEEADYIVLAQSRGNPVTEESWADTVQIPRVALVSITPLIDLRLENDPLEGA